MYPLSLPPTATYGGKSGYGAPVLPLAGLLGTPTRPAAAGTRRTRRQGGFGPLANLRLR